MNKRASLKTRTINPLGLVVLAWVSISGCRQMIYEAKIAAEEQQMNTSSIYPADFAGPRRDSTLAVVTAAKGRIAWIQPLGPGGPLPRATLLPWPDRVLVTGGAGLVLFSATGTRLWERGKRADSPVGVTNDLLYYETPGSFLEAVDRNNTQRLVKAPLPGASTAEHHVTLLWPRDKDVILTVALPSPTYDTEDLDAVPPEPKVSGVRAIYGELCGRWGKTYGGPQALPSLFIPELARWIIFTEQVITVDLNEGQEMAPFTLPLAEPSDWCAGTDGGLFVLGYDQEKKALVALSGEGIEAWRWADAAGDDRWAVGQPPILAPKGRVYALTSGRVLALEAGKLVWSYDAAGFGPRRASSLADGSLLVAAGRHLLHLKADGKLRFSLELDAEIVTAPVVDAEGRIYVATTTHLVQIL